MAWNEGTVNQMQQGEMAPAVAPGRQRAHTWVRLQEAVIVLVAALWAASLVSHHASLGHDQGWYLYAAKLVLQGAHVAGPYLSDTNPPLIVWFSVLPMTLAQVLSIPPALAFFIFVIVLAAGSCLYCFRVLRRSNPGQSILQTGLLAASIFFIECHVPWSTDFGQREQFLVLFLMPLVTLLGSPQTGNARRQFILPSVAAAFGVCLKPQHAITLFALQLTFMFLHRRSLRVASLAVWSVTIALLMFSIYAVVVYLLAPDYVLKTVPLLQKAYWVYGTRPAHAILLERRFLFFLAASTCLYGCLRKRYNLSSMPLILLAGCAGSHISFALQHTGWVYQEIPQNAFVELFGLCVAVELLCNGWLASAPRPRLLWVRCAGLAAYIAVFITAFFAMNAKNPSFTGRGERPDSETGTKNFFRGLPAKTPIFVFSTQVIPAFPAALDDNLIWASRSPCLWTLPAIVQNETDLDRQRPPDKRLNKATASQMADALRGEVAADLGHWHPVYVLVPRCTKATPCLPVLPENFPMLDWFSRDSAFRDVWSSYVYDRAIPDTQLHTVWDVYRLRP